MSIVTSRLMAPMAGIELYVDWFGIVGEPHYLRIIEAQFTLSEVFSHVFSFLVPLPDLGCINNAISYSSFE